MAIQNLLSCDGLLPARVRGAYWKLSSTGGSVELGGIAPHTERWVSQIFFALKLKDGAPDFRSRWELYISYLPNSIAMFILEGFYAE
ncbi:MULTISPECIES: hypothetical protein [Aeromonas]|uniref:hypothetical protein n=1 Tax=Aeromonas TaxID=642 RepID=UPI00191CD10F|nr:MULTISPECIES: hypothetical protein [Aeromonas]MBL0462279.1 hypothetical protein [Aeromonas dhakensis]MBL0600841.1 hypothetical protein [Aeromonas dhakensis]MBL0620056.1 hypothetical protein [Aeromonas dhakensis]MBL0658390.1 hypothetical protein [Aeromonas dhakensis]WAG12220.1 hypothetical protein NRZ32_03535 [Aeromonas dhakensis]